MAASKGAGTPLMLCLLGRAIAVYGAAECLHLRKFTAMLLLESSRRLLLLSVFILSVHLGGIVCGLKPLSIEVARAHLSLSALW